MVSTGFPKLFGQITCPDLFMSADQVLRSVSGAKEIARIKEFLPQLQIIQVPGAATAPDAISLLVTWRSWSRFSLPCNDLVETF